MKQKATNKKYEGSFRARATKKAQTSNAQPARSASRSDVGRPNAGVSDLRKRNENHFQSASVPAHDMDVVPAKQRPHRHGAGALLLIAVFKFIKGAVLIALAFGALSLLHKDVASQVEHWLDGLRIDSDNKFIGGLLSKLQLVHTKELKQMSALGAGYAALFLTEGTGLLLRKRWAEWLTIIATSSLMPIEIYELMQKFTAVRLLALVMNAAVVLYLIYLVRQKEK